MKVGTDGVLVGAWADGGRRVLDIGSGTGLIALMMAQRFAGASVVGIDIDPEACAQARENVAASPFAGQVSIENVTLQDFPTGEKFDCIVSNPPYFQNSLKNPDSRRATARHSDSLPFPVLFGRVAELLEDGGRFSAVVPSGCASSFVAEASLHGLSVVRRCDVRTTERKQPRRCLLAFARQAGVAVERCEVTLQMTDGSRSPWYDALTRDFYIK